MRLFAVADRELSRDRWFTPAWVFDGLGLTFDLDVCAPTGGAPNVPAHRWFTESDNGLEQPWLGLVWCNPPFSNPLPWCRRFADHPDAVLLVRADLSSRGPYVALEAADAVLVPRGRIEYDNATGDKPPHTGRTAFSSVLFARGAPAVAALGRLARYRPAVARRLVLLEGCRFFDERDVVPPPLSTFLSPDRA